MHTTNAIILCLVSYPCIVAWVIYKNRFVDYLFLTLLACLGSIFSVVLYKQPDYSLTIYQAVAVGYAAVIMPTVLVLSVVKEGANKRGNSSRLTQSFHFFMFEPIFSPVNALNQPI
ncbi:hypothetical protein ACVUOA_005583 [Klebsiella pneumoniae]